MKGCKKKKEKKRKEKKARKENQKKKKPKKKTPKKKKLNMRVRSQYRNSFSFTGDMNSPWLVKYTWCDAVVLFI